MPRRDRLHVVIAGGGVAALETLLALRALAGHLVDVTLLSPTTEFIYRPVTVAEAFDRAQAPVYDLVEILADQGGELIRDTLADVEVRSRIVVSGSGSGRRIPFDALVVATGAVPRVPFPGAFAFRGRDLPSERVWPLPLYELALMTAAHLKEDGAPDVSVTRFGHSLGSERGSLGPAKDDLECTCVRRIGNVSYAFMVSPSANRWIANSEGSSRPLAINLISRGVLNVSISPVVSPVVVCGQA